MCAISRVTGEYQFEVGVDERGVRLATLNLPSNRDYPRELSFGWDTSKAGYGTSITSYVSCGVDYYIAAAGPNGVTPWDTRTAGGSP